MYHRYIVEYRKRANITMNYLRSKDMIIHDHVAAEDRKLQDVGYMKLPDGSYEGLQWMQNKWVWKEYVPIGENETNQVIRPVPIKDPKSVYQINK